MGFETTGTKAHPKQKANLASTICFKCHFLLPVTTLIGSRGLPVDKFILLSIRPPSSKVLTFALTEIGLLSQLSLKKMIGRG
ncbi:hypothetical protein PsalN5692_03748 (plasmid) [Piscirickettsia salmonis]|nr:hypothetical protein [Piscirickettsia salmonis]QGP52240.1 hypothetical protein PsalN5692_03748 [Piscirickettsia salmonis]